MIHRQLSSSGTIDLSLVFKRTLLRIDSLKPQRNGSTQPSFCDSLQALTTLKNL